MPSTTLLWFYAGICNVNHCSHMQHCLSVFFLLSSSFHKRTADAFAKKVLMMLLMMPRLASCAFNVLVRAFVFVLCIYQVCGPEATTASF